MGRLRVFVFARTGPLVGSTRNVFTSKALVGSPVFPSQKLIATDETGGPGGWALGALVYTPWNEPAANE